MNYLQIEAFMKIVEVGSMTKAADALFVSQSTLSDRINKLENDLNVELFSRGHGPRGLI
ncbi:MAG: LysR family transcriptional regulator [Neofamilia sp.]